MLISIHKINVVKLTIQTYGSPRSDLCSLFNHLRKIYDRAFKKDKLKCG